MAKKIKADDEKLSQLISEDGYFVVSKKSIKWGLSILSFVLFALWGSLQYSVSDANSKTDANNKYLTDQVIKTNEALKEIVETLKRDEIKPLEDKVQKLEITDAFILGRTDSRANTTGSNGNLPSNGSNPLPPSELPGINSPN